MPTFIKIIIGFALLSLVLSNSKLEELLSLLSHANYEILLWIIPLYIISIFLASYRWWLLIPSTKYLELSKSNFVLAYYMIFVPGQLVAEAIKGARLISEKHKSDTIFCSIFLDKILALTALVLIALSAISFEKPIPELQYFKLVLIIILLLLLSLLFYFPWLLSFFDRLCKIPALSSNKIWQFIDLQINSYRAKYLELVQGYKNLGLSLLAALLFQLLNIFMLSLLGSSIGIGFAFSTWAWIVAVLSIVLMLPLSIGGIGLREGGLALIFTILGESLEKSLSYALMLYALSLMGALIAYIVDLMTGVPRKI